jgi:hypothetical protein
MALMEPAKPQNLTLRQARCAFTQAIAYLILFAAQKGYEIALDEGMDRKTEKDPTTDHMKNSLHELGLAQDLVLYLAGNYLEKTEEYSELGYAWEEYGIQSGLPLVWGGRFNDGNHFSFAWGGRK